MRRWTAALPVLGLLLAGAQGAAARAQVRLAVTRFSEHVTPRETGAPGSSLMGVVAGDLAEPIQGSSFTVFGVDPGDRTLCVHIERMNGSYRADLLLSVEGRLAGRTTLPVELGGRSQHLDRLRGRPQGEVALDVQASSELGGCGAEADHVAAGWSASGRLPLTAILLAPDIVSSVVGGSGCGPLRMVRGVEGQQTSFDTACRLPAMPSRCGGVAEASIRRQEADSGERLPTERLRYRPSC